MPEALTTTQSRSRAQRLALNSDRRRHPLLNVAAAFTFLAGAAAFPLGLIVREHLAATVIGMAAFGIGMVAQLLSATRAERIFIVSGLVAAFVGMGLGIAHGGFG
jgi:ABC-type Co2+ transport system permease subunit